jgi:fumarate reductase subunit C
MRYMFRPHRVIFRQYIIKESTALGTLSVVLLRYVVVIIINFDVMGCVFFLSFVLRPLCAPLVVAF